MVVKCLDTFTYQLRAYTELIVWMNFRKNYPLAWNV